MEFFNQNFNFNMVAKIAIIVIPDHFLTFTQTGPKFWPQIDTCLNSNLIKKTETILETLLDIKTEELK